MKYFYTTLLLLVTLAATSQNLYWIGGSTGDWNNTANWSLSSGGTSAGIVPASGNTAVFNTSAEVNFNVASATITGLHVLNTSNVKLIANAAATITVTSTSAVTANLGLYVAANSTLIDSMANVNGEFVLQFADNAKGQVDGNLVVTGVPGGGPNFGKSRLGFNAHGASTNNNTLLVFNGTYRQSSLAGGFGLSAAQRPFVQFNSGSTLWITTSGGSIGPATFDPNSTVYLTGATGPFPTLTTVTQSLGNLTVDFENPITTANPALSVLSSVPIRGNLTIKRTGGVPLHIAQVTGTSDIKVEGDFVVETGAQAVIGSHNNNPASLEVGGDFIMTGGSLLFRKTPVSATTYTTPTVLRVLGNIQQTAGTLTTGTVSVSSTDDELFVVEMAGTSAQTITATGGDWDNALKNIVLRINNNNGVTLASNVRVSKVSWNSVNEGIINTTTGSPLTILNPSTTDATVMNNVGNTGYVDGPVRRVTNSTQPYIFPIGDGGVYRTLAIIPEDANAAVFEAQYWNQGFANTNTSPIMHGISGQEYWRASRISGSTLGSVQLSLNGVIPGTASTDGLVVASYNGSQWGSEYAGTVSNILVPGNTDEGAVSTEYSSLGRYYTFGFGTAATLPIELKKFNVSKVNNNQASVEWEITAESTPVSFIIERSVNGVEFTPIATVKATTATQYQYIDTELPSGRIYYRLRMIDQDASVNYSEIQSVQINATNEKLQVYPTVSNTQTQIKLNISKSSKVTLLVSDNSGRVIERNVHSLSAGTQVITLNVSRWSNGVHYIVVLFEDGTTTAPQRFIKQ